jgi:uncharacterized repeat protein (TIGR03803 family)
MLGAHAKVLSSSNAFRDGRIAISIPHGSTAGGNKTSTLGLETTDKVRGAIGDDGSLFGTTEAGGVVATGANGPLGTVFELTNHNGTWTETVIHTFVETPGGNTNGVRPVAGLTPDGSGNLYGATSQGGAKGGGTVFELSPSGDTWTFKLLYNFGGQGQCGPWANMTMDAAGNLYGTTYCDGQYGYGSVFKLTNNGNSWVYTSLYDFTRGDDGAYPISNVTFDDSGNLYGTTSEGGRPGAGVVWMIKP